MAGVNGTVLIVDDNADVRETLALLLSLENYGTCTATNRDEALEELSIREPHVVLLDWFMPGVSLEEFVIKARAIYPYIQMVLLSASPNIETKAKDLGVLCLGKPYEPTHVLALIGHCVQRRGGLASPHLDGTGAR